MNVTAPLFEPVTPGEARAWTPPQGRADIAPSRFERIEGDGYFSGTVAKAMRDRDSSPAERRYAWELYHVAQDYSENKDLAASMPEKLRELQETFLVEAEKYNVFPLDNTSIPRALAPRPSATAGRDVFTYSGALSGLNSAAAPDILNRSYTITAQVDVPQSGAEGMIVTLGGRFGGYGLYLLKGKPVFLYNLLGLERFRWEGQQPLAAGKHMIVFDFTYDGPGFAKGGTGILKVDGAEVASRKIPHTIPFRMTIDETFDIGMDTLVRRSTTMTIRCRSRSPARSWK